MSLNGQLPLGNQFFFNLLDADEGMEFPMKKILGKLLEIKSNAEIIQRLALCATRQEMHLAARLMNDTRNEMLQKFADIMNYVPVKNLKHQQKIIQFLIDEDMMPSFELMFAGSSIYDGLNIATILDVLDLPFYTTRADGTLDCYNAAAATLWGWKPPIGEQQWCGSWKLFTEDGLALRHDECAMAVCLQKQKPVRYKRAMGERPDGSRFTFCPFPSPLVNEAGAVVGAINVLLDISACVTAEARQVRQ